MKKSENADASEHEDGVDMISNLPDHLLLLILSRLPGTEEAIRTSVLSTRWMYLWTLMPSIDIDYTRGLGPHRSLHRDGFNDFVYWVLLNKPQDLDSFRLSCPDNCNMLTIRQWIHAAVMRKVKLIDLTLCPRATYGGMLYEKIEVPHCLMTCGSLEVLRLRLLGPRHCLPYIHGFSALRALELNNVEFSDYTIKNCPLLEDFSLIDCFAYDLKISNPKLKNLRIDNRQLFGDKEAAANKFGLIRGMCQGLEISCPKLVFLKLIGYVAMFFLFEDLYSLKEAVIHPKGLYELEPPTSDLFTGIPHVEFLSISLYCIRACFDPEVNYPISLPNLKKLELIVDGKNMDLLIPFLKCLPDLESLHLIIPKDICSLDKWNLDEAATMSILTRHLKKVEFRVFDEENSKLVVARALLEHGNELEELVFSWDNEARFHERSMETMNEVSKFHKASSTVKLRCVIKPIQDNS